MIKNSILGKLCPVFHLRSAAVASLQNLNHWLVWPGTVPWCDSEVEHTLVGGWDMEEVRRTIVGVMVQGSIVENYTTIINHFCTAIFSSPSISCFPHPLLCSACFSALFLHFMAVHPFLLLFRWSPGFLPFILNLFPGNVLYLKHCWSPSLPISHPSWLHLHCGLFTCFLY